MIEYQISNPNDEHQGGMPCLSQGASADTLWQDIHPLTATAFACLAQEDIWEYLSISYPVGAYLTY